MKKALKIIGIIFAVIIGVPLLGILLIYIVVTNNIWPPTCSILPIPHAKMVCEFSKIDKVKKGESATYSFWVTVPHSTAGDVFLAIDGKEPQKMDKIGGTDYSTVSLFTVGDTINYHYENNGVKSSDVKLAITRKNKKNYDYVKSWTGEASKLPADIVPGVIMFDTWSINYNFNFFEDTRKTFVSSMDRVVALGAKRFDVFSMYEIVGTKNNFTLQPISSPYKYFRDSGITLSEMKKIANEAKKRSLETVIHYNVQADYSGVFSQALSGKVKYGTGGNDAEASAGELLGRNEPKTKEYLDILFLQLEAALTKMAKDAQTAGISGIDITPQYRFPPSDPLQSYADEKYANIIKQLRNVYKGKIYASNFADWGGLSGIKRPKYIDEADGVYMFIGSGPQKLGENPTALAIAYEYTATLETIKDALHGYGKPVYLVATISSYDGFYNGKPGTEWNDFIVVDSMGYKEDWQEQADGYEGLFRALENDKSNFFSGIYTAGYWYDDLMAPLYMNPRNNMMSTIRNKPAEAVWQKWLKK